MILINKDEKTRFVWPLFRLCVVNWFRMLLNNAEIYPSGRALPVHGTPPCTYWYHLKAGELCFPYLDIMQVKE